MSAEYCLNCKANSAKDVISNNCNDDTLFPSYHSELKTVFTYEEIWTGDGQKLYLCILCRTLFQTLQSSKERFLNLTKPKTKIALLLNQNKHDRLFKCDQSGANEFLNTDIEHTKHKDDECTQKIESILPDNEINNDELSTELNNSTDTSSNGMKIVDFQEKFLKLQIKKLSKDFNENFHNKSYLKKGLKSNNCKTIKKILECTKCGRKFQDFQLLQNHNSSAHFECIEYKFSCKFCPQNFSSQWFFTNHVKSRHDGIEIVHFCRLCRKMFHNAKELKDHMLKAHDFREHAFKCRHCTESFKKIQRLRSHLLEHHKGTKEAESAESNLKLLGQTMRKCNYCPETYNSLNKLRNHIKLAHDKPNYECMVCKKLFSSQQKMVIHRKIHKHCELCDKTFENFERLKGHIENVHQIDENRPYSCEMCGQCHKSNSRLLAHYYWHININGPKHFCNICDKSFKLRHHLTQHIEFTHSKSGKKHKCGHCEKEYKEKFKLNSHMEIDHQAECNVLCKTCGKKFLTQRSLYAHSRMHTIATNYKSGYCSAFKNVNLMDSKTQRPVDKIEVTSCFSTETMLFTCPICGKTCESQTHFIRHFRLLHNITGFRDPNIKLSSNIKCPECDKCFSRKDLLTRHKRKKHVNNSSVYIPNEFECPYCLKTLKNCQFKEFMDHYTKHEILIVHSNKKKKVKSKKELIEFCNAKDKSYTCFDCDLKCGSRTDFFKHLKQKIHLDEYKIEYLDEKNKAKFSFQCPKCPRSFPSSSLWQIHKDMHSFVRKRDREKKK